MKISELKILKSNAGFYIGRTYTDEELDVELPYSRESSYFLHKEIAQLFLNSLKLMESN